jgi:hypothetical protein
MVADWNFRWLPSSVELLQSMALQLLPLPSRTTAATIYALLDHQIHPSG